MKNYKGAHLSGQELHDLIHEAKLNDDFLQMNIKLKDLAQFDIDSSKVSSAYHFDELLGESILYGKFVILQSADNLVNISYNKAIYQGKTNVFVVGSIIDSNNKIIKKYAVVNGEEVEIEDVSNKENLNNVIQENLENSPSYKPGELAGVITPQATFCLYDFPKFYNHCGPNCGDGLTLGGGEPINGLDECCRGHDRCWVNFGDGDCECNTRLIACALKYNDKYPKNTTLVVGWFSGNVC